MSIWEEQQNVRMLMNYRRMRSVKRCNNFLVYKPEDVAQHSYFVAQLAMVLVDEYNQYIQEFWVEDTETKFVSVEKVLRKALLHDTDEAFSSDIPWNIKHSTPEAHEQINKAVELMMDKVYEGTSDLFLSYHDMAAHCKDGFEGQIVDVADMLELALHCWEEYAIGNHWMKPLLDKCVKIIRGFVDGTEILDACPTLVEILRLLQEKPTEERIASLIDID